MRSRFMSHELSELFLSKTPLIDVRAPVEFQAGHLPNSVNLPLMSDEERHLVGICYKEKGQEAAIKLGHELVSGENKKKKIQAWIDFLTQHPRAQVMCLRGGLRSQISCQWITQAGIPRVQIPGGYKRLRSFLLAQIEEAPLPQMIRLGGLTGTGKTQFLQSVPDFLDLEELASHRGSAFGERGVQPSQASFESALGAALLGKNRVVVEDESIRLGNVRIPPRFFQAMQASKLVVLERSMEERVETIYREYVSGRDHEFFRSNLQRIERKLGGLRFKVLLDLLAKGFAAPSSVEAHRPWIEILLREYYDPAYEYGLQRQQELIVLRGGEDEVREILRASN